LVQNLHFTLEMFSISASKMMVVLIKQWTGKPWRTRSDLLSTPNWPFICFSLESSPMSHVDWIWSAWTTIFFLWSWHQSINHNSNPLMSIARNGVSRQIYKIFHFLGDSLIGLIISNICYC
jgi:hypothetical protein